jgi:hypothetical protein
MTPSENATPEPLASSARRQYEVDVDHLIARLQNAYPYHQTTGRPLSDISQGFGCLNTPYQQLTLVTPVIQDRQDEVVVLPIRRAELGL